MTKQIKVDFYRIKLLDNPTVSFENIIQSVEQSTNDATRSVKINGYPVRLQVAKAYPNFCSGDMIRIRMDDTPTVASVSGDTELLNLDDDEGLGEETAFLYQIPTMVLMLQRNRNGVSESSFAKYFTAKSGIEVRLEPVVQGDVIARITRMQTISKFEITVAGASTMSALKGQDLAVDEILSLSNRFHAQSVTMEVSVGNQKTKSLSFGTVIESATKLFSHATKQLGDIKTIKVSGDTENGHLEVLDLLQDWVRETIDVNPVDNRRISYDERSQCLRDAWEKQRDLLEEMFPAQNP